MEIANLKSKANLIYRMLLHKNKIVVPKAEHNHSIGRYYSTVGWMYINKYQVGFLDKYRIEENASKRC